MSLPDKPRFMEKCNGCGLCCALELCIIGRLAHPGASAPCPSLKLEADGSRTYCEIVRAEQSFRVPPVIAATLGIGIGCSMHDDTEDEKRFRELAGQKT